ncbi:trigger factor [Neosynechococcus sphagnicola sy1]|uniref:Trigger factor n=1 Tax=Neosynechococcus sphagnicola sy1 TaxID=1497020 RepID=A0A098TN27_9CYAN|nr:trigger factor [Neosynechococcus sphagnicola]KGF72248.1 trigger factor [Neosynechococcus sphagnicola sy1]
MKVTQEKLPASQVGLEIEIPSEMSKQAYEKVIQKFTQSANIPGFRRGKVPRQILIQRIGSTHIKEVTVEGLVQDGIKEALSQAEILPIGSPQLLSSFESLVSQFVPGTPLTFTAAIDVQPEVTLTQYQGFQVQAEEVPFNPDQVDQAIETHRQQVATLVPVEARSAQLGDIAIVDYQGRFAVNEADADEPTIIPGGEATDFQVELAPGRFVDGFVEGITGMNPGEIKEFPVQFPDNYPTARLAGQGVIFTITLKELKEKELPELNDEFAQEVSEFETFAALQASLETQYRTEAERKTQDNKEEALVHELLQHVEVDLPETLVRQEIDYLITQTAVQLQSQGMDIRQLFTADSMPKFRERSRPDAIALLRRSLALQEIAKREAITVAPEAITTKVQEVLAQNPGRDVDSERLQQVVADDLLAAAVLSWLEAHSTVELVPLGTLTAATPDPETEPSESAEATEVSEATETVVAVDEP